MQSGWSSGIAPRPIGEVMNGSASASTSSRNAANGDAQRTPLPMINSGRLAPISMAAACSITAESGSGSGGSASDEGARAAVRRNPGQDVLGQLHQHRAGPPVHRCFERLRMDVGISAVLATRIAHFVTGR